MSFVNSLIRDKKPCYFISPHLDDAALSAGGLLSYLRGKVPIQVITIFTKPLSPNTLYAKRYIQKCGFQDAYKLFIERVKEDKVVFSSRGVYPQCLDYVDAAWRKKDCFAPSILNSIFPELIHVYPTRFHVLGGKIHKDDEILVQSLTRRLKRLVKSPQESVVFCPLGVGGHVDHLIVHNVCSALFKNVIYWSDFPYNLKKKPQNSHAIKFEWYKNIKNKKDLILGYKTQHRALFKEAFIPIIPEIFYE